MPSKPNEVLADAERFGEGDIGKKITLSSFDKNGKKMLENQEYTIVGIIHSPLYIGIDRGTTSIGSGALTSFLYCQEENFKSPVYTEVSLTLKETAPIYSEEYDKLVSGHKEKVQELTEKIVTEFSLPVAVMDL